MKNTITLLLSVLLVGVLFISFSSACNIDHHRTYSDLYQNSLDTNDGVIFIVYDNQYHGSEIYQNENSDRHPVSDYAYGYTYRADNSYYSKPVILNSRDDSTYQNNHFGPNWFFDGKRDYTVYQASPNYYYQYNDYTNTYEQHTCYVNPPTDKLFYVRCP
ncbi:Uncharacterised protein [uncultured archaeon]|nr:Uncharacterised protein [uncultured archaeon]